MPQALLHRLLVRPLLLDALLVQGRRPCVQADRHVVIFVGHLGEHRVGGRDEVGPRLGTSGGSSTAR